ncbi:MAG: IS630 family transposase [Bacteroidota bacterium]
MYKNDIKHRAIVHYKHFLRSIRKVSAIYNIGKSTLWRWLKQDGLIKRRTKRANVLDNIAQFIKSKMESNPFVTSDILSKLVKKELSIDVSKTSCWRCIKRNNYTYKRSRMQVSTPSNSIERLNDFKVAYSSKTNFISIDETFFYIVDRPKYGYSKKGTPLKTNISKAPKTKKLTLYLAISEAKIIGYKISTCHGNSKDFLEFIQSLELDKNTLLMDNVSFHKSKAIKEFVESKQSSILFVPPYCPDYNPIELAFSKIKNIYRKSNDLLLDLETMKENVEHSIKSLSNNDLYNYFRHVNSLVKSI